MKKTLFTTITVLLFFVANAQKPVKLSKLEKKIIEVKMQDYCRYLTLVSEGNYDCLPILDHSIVEHFANTWWNDLTSDPEEIPFGEYLKLIMKNKIKIKFTKLPDSDDFMYFQSLDKYNYVIAPIEIQINNKTSRGYLVLRVYVNNNRIVNYKKELPSDVPIFIEKRGKLKVMKK